MTPKSTDTKPPGPIIGTSDLLVGELSPYHHNPRRGNIDAIAESLQVLRPWPSTSRNAGTDSTLSAT